MLTNLLMAILKNIETGELVLLQSQHMFGRNIYGVNTYICNEDVSRQHATIYWKEGVWYFKDHSRNGSFVNNQLIHMDNLKLKFGDKIRFCADRSIEWCLDDIKPPSSYLVSVTDKCKFLQLISCHALPSEDHPDISFFYTSEGVWNASVEDTIIKLENNHIYKFNNESWKYVENEVFDETIDYGSSVKDSCFCFTLSPDEEHINVKIVLNNMVMDLGDRVHNYLLLALARGKYRDIKNRYNIDDQGWCSVDLIIEDLSKECCKNVDVYYLNLLIYRLRKQLIGLKPFGFKFSNIIERRSGELRFAHNNFVVMKEGKCILSNGEVCVI